MIDNPKILVLGMDGMDPRITKRFLEEGIMPNTKKFIERGAQRSDLSALGATPTVTPPIWTTLATGAYANTHGITCFWQQSHEDLDELTYSLNSELCKAEPFWNVFAESGKKTLVWHWPGSSWPPTSDSPNLHVVEGTQPSAINLGVAMIDWENITFASEEFETLSFKPNQGTDTGAGCVIKDVGIHEDDSGNMYSKTSRSDAKMKNIIFSHLDGEGSCEVATFDVTNSPIKEAHGWTNAPEGAKEFIMLSSKGLIRRPCLVLKNSEGKYDTIAVYKSKRESEPLFALKDGEMIFNFVDECITETGDKGQASRNYKLLNIAEDGSSLKIWMSVSLDISKDLLFHPKALYKDVVENVGYVPPAGFAGSRIPEIIENCLLPSWSNYCEWQGKALNHVIESQGYDVIYSHLHNIDICGHIFWNFAKKRERLEVPEEVYQNFIRQAYIDADKYIGEFLHLLDKGWTIFIVADHGLNVCEEDEPALLGDLNGVNARDMVKMGYTVLKKDENGNDIKEIDWTKTRAVASRGNHIWINLKGRNKTGIVDPEDKYELEEEVINSLYDYRENGHRVVSLAVRNKDAAVFNMNGPECGDIVYFMHERFAKMHGDSISTVEGYFNTSAAPIFLCAGKGLKNSTVIDRVIRQVDLSPTLAVLAGVRMAEQCEGAPIYQILE